MVLIIMNYYRPQRSCEGYVLMSFCSRGGVCLSACWDTTPPGGTPPREAHTPWEAHPPGSTPPPPGTHSTGMHSWFIYLFGL